ncbi:MAG: DUF1904 family protein [Clostridia bacterium]|nr:DUF1904 family protein [Clostridia bacterium]
MPHIKFRGMKRDEVQEMSTELLNALVNLINVPRDHFTLELEESTFFHDGELHKNAYPFVNVEWFDRGVQTMQAAAEIITKAIKAYPYNDVTVYFTNLNKEHYFENGEHF